jgi:hypothetical protein
MEAATLQFELEEFEYIPATAGTALVRIAGTWRAEAEQDLPPVALLVRTPVGEDRIAPLPDAARDGAKAGAEGSPWRAAFSLAIHVLTTGNATFLLDGEGVQIELPAPRERGADGRVTDRRAAGRELQVANDELRTRVAELERQLEETQQEMKPRQARTVAKAREELDRARADAERERQQRSNAGSRLRSRPRSAPGPRSRPRKGVPRRSCRRRSSPSRSPVPSSSG